MHVSFCLVEYVGGGQEIHARNLYHQMQQCLKKKEKEKSFKY